MNSTDQADYKNIWPNEPLDSVVPVEEIELVSLQRFFQHPIRYFYNHRLGINLAIDDLPDDEENFELDALQRWSLIDEIARRYKDGLETGFELLSAQGLLPHGEAARTSWAELIADSQSLNQQLHDYRELQPVSRYLEFALGNNTRLSGEIKACYSGLGLMHFSASRKIKSRAITGLWLEHLALCASQQLTDPEHSRLITRDSPPATFRLLEVEPAARLLKEYSKIFQQGLLRPLPVFPDSSFAWASQTDPERALKEACKTWLPSFIGQGECDDPYIRQVIPEKGTDVFEDEWFRQLAHQIYRPILENLVEGG